jgi:hypothetical protein
MVTTNGSVGRHQAYLNPTVMITSKPTPYNIVWELRERYLNARAKDHVEMDSDSA